MKFTKEEINQINQLSKEIYKKIEEVKKLKRKLDEKFQYKEIKKSIFDINDTLPKPKFVIKAKN